MSLIGVIVVLIVVGILLWVVETQLGQVLDATIIKIIRIVVIVAVVLWILSIFFPGIMGSIQVGRVR
jgi:hypothetical protein